MAKKVLNVEEARKGDFDFKPIEPKPENEKAGENQENPTFKLTNLNEEQVKALLATAPKTPDITDSKTSEEKPKKQRRRRLKRERKQISVYLSPAQYQIISDLADDSNKNLSDTVGMIIDEYYELQQRRRLSNATRAKRKKDQANQPK